MANNRVVKADYTNKKEILKFNEFVATSVTVGQAGVAAVAGRKIVPAGTIVGGKATPVFTKPEEPVEDKNSTAKGDKAEGVLLYDVDVTDGDREGSMVIYGYVDLAKIPKAPDATVVLPKITFMK